MSLADRDAFVTPRKARWERLERLLGGALRAPEWSELASAYRSVCADLSRARSLGMPHDVQRYLDDLSGRAHNRLYSVRGAGFGLGLVQDAIVAFPREVRRQWAFVLLASLLFYVPFGVGALGSYADASMASMVLPDWQLEQMETMYGGDDRVRDFASNAMMAGFYVQNNVGIAFRCFATGALAGLGSIFFLVYNGLVIGTTFGYLGNVGLGGNLLEFTSGHSAWELTGICISGAAGLRLGWSMIVTDGRTFVGSLRRAAPVLYRLILGTAVLLFVAAAIEGFWSASPVPRTVKFGFGLAQWVIVGAWLVFGGRRAPVAGLR